jgi:hypothetical protein
VSAVSEHFIIPGAQRAGTTFLYGMLAQHPEIEMARPLRPEPKFFLDARCVERGLPAYRGLFWSRAGTARMLGEKSTSYLETAEVPGRIRALLPDARILIVLRDPVDRAISNYQFSRENGLEAGSIDEAFYHEEQRSATLDWPGVSVCPVAYLRRGRYAEQIPLWEEHFPRARIHLVLFEGLVRDPAVITSIFRFLGVDPGFRPCVPSRSVNSATGAPVAVSGRLRRYLMEYFAEPNRRLADRYGLDLSCWSSARAAGAGGHGRALEGSDGLAAH